MLIMYKRCIHIFIIAVFVSLLFNCSNDANLHKSMSITGIEKASGQIAYDIFISTSDARSVDESYEIPTLIYSDNGIDRPVLFSSSDGDIIVLFISQARKLGADWLAINFAGYYPESKLDETHLHEVDPKLYLLNFSTRKAYDLSAPLFIEINGYTMDVSDLLYFNDGTNEYVVFTARAPDIVESGTLMWAIKLDDPTRPYAITNETNTIGEPVYITKSGFVYSDYGTAYDNPYNGFADVRGVYPYRHPSVFTPEDDLDINRIGEYGLLIDRWGNNHYINDYVGLDEQEDVMWLGHSPRAVFGAYSFDTYCYDISILSKKACIMLKLTDDESKPVILDEIQFQTEIPEQYWKVLKSDRTGEYKDVVFDQKSNHLYFIDGNGLYDLDLVKKDAVPELIYKCGEFETFTTYDDNTQDKLELINGRLYFTISSGVSELRNISYDIASEEVDIIIRRPDYSSLIIQEFSF